MSLNKFLNSTGLRQIFLIDCLGALVSTVMLGVVLVRFEGAFGMPVPVLYALASIALVFACYSFLGFMGKLGPRGIYLQIIATANLLYCCLTLVLVWYHFPSLTALGIAYFVLEKLIVVPLAMFEWKRGREMDTGR